VDFDLSKPQKLLQQSARDLLAARCSPQLVRQAMATETADDEALWSAAADQGWLGIIVPERFGGLGLGVVELAAVAEEMGRACLPGPLLSTIFAGAVIARMGTSEQQARWLEPLARGELRSTVAILEQTASWDLDAIRCTAAATRQGVVVRGQKHFVYDAGVADVILVVARDGADLVVAPVERSAPAMTIVRTPSMDETRKLSVVTLDDVSVGTPEVLRGPASALAAAIDTATVALCAEMVGGMQWILDTTVEYAKTRQQFGRAIGSFQAVQHHCADILLLTESARSATYYAAWTLSHDPAAAPLATSMAKAYCSDAYRQVGNLGVQVHGGIGFTWEHDLQLYYKRSKASETLFGDATFHRERIASQIVQSRSDASSATRGGGEPMIAAVANKEA
jgi:alkylation response protein AidB-like acyl-CoA dehydrogenase